LWGAYAYGLAPLSGRAAPSLDGSLGSLYAEAKADPTARALVVVALAHGLGRIIRAVAFERVPHGKIA
jgi:hypothetical protein